MNLLDVLILIVCAALAVLGYAQGFIVGAASLAGLALGGLVGTRVTRVLLERGIDDPSASAWAPVIGLVVGLIITLVGAMAMQDIGAEIRGRVDVAEHAAVDHVLGAVLLVAVGLLIAWFTAAAAIGVPQMRSLRPQIVDSSIVGKLNAMLPDARPVLGAISSYDPFPEFNGGRIIADAPDGRLPKDAEVRDASRSVVRVVGSACGYQITGSGWVASPGYVVTNAHVVAGEDDTAVQPAGKGDPLDADVVAFDDVNDIAVLRVHDLDLTPLQMLGDVESGTAGAVLGYPENRGFTATAARFSDLREVRAKDIYDEKSVDRNVTSFRGLVRHGNSGGPLVDDDGHVLTTVFAATVGAKVEGGYGVPNDITLQAVKQGQAVPKGYGVKTGKCVS